MRFRRGAFAALLILGLVVGVTILVLRLPRRARPPLTAREQAPIPPPVAASPAADAGPRDLDQPGILDDIPTRDADMSEVMVEAADAGTPDVLPADEVSRSTMEELPAGFFDAEPTPVELEIEVAELASEPSNQADEPMPVELDEPEPAVVSDAPSAGRYTPGVAAAIEPPAEVEATMPVPAVGAARAEALLDEGNSYFNVGQYALAIARYTEAIHLDPGLVAALYNRANARTRLGEYNDALADYDAALALNPRDTDALNNRGMLHLHRGDPVAALADLGAALAIDPHDTTVVVNRGLVHLQAGEARLAFDDFAEAARIDPRDASAHYGAAQACALLGDPVAAISSLRNAFRLDNAYVREAAADPHLAALQGDPDFVRLLRDGGR